MRRAGPPGRAPAGRPSTSPAPTASPFAFAGLWSIWHGPEDSTIRSCTIITTAANEAVAPLHDRMPVILEPDAEAVWLDHGTAPAVLFELMAGLDAPRTALHPVGPAVNDARYDGPECLAPPGPEVQPALF